MTERDRDTADRTAPGAGTPEREPYTPPQLTVYGRLEELTRFDFQGGPADQPFGDFSS